MPYWRSGRKKRKSISSLPPFYAGESSLVPHHEQCGRVVAPYEIVEIERLSDDETGAVEGVVGFQFGVFAFNHFEAAFAEVLQQHAAVGSPRDGDVSVFGDIGGVEGAAQHRVGGFAFAVAVGGEVVPVAEAHAAGEDGKGGEAGDVVAVDIAPDALEGADAEGFVATLLDDAGEELEVGGGFHLPRHRLLHHLTEHQNIVFVRVHTLIVEAAKIAKKRGGRGFFLVLFGAFFPTRGYRRT